MRIFGLWFGVFFFLCACAHASQYTFDRNIYGFEASYGDTGNFALAFSWFTYNPYTPVQPASVSYIGPFGRFSNGANGVDLVVRKYGLTLSNSLEITELPQGYGNYVNFAIGGATSSGNVNNLYNSSVSTYSSGVGNNSYISMVNLWLEYKQQSGVEITSKDIFYLGTVGGNDLPAIISTYFTNRSGFQTDFDDSINTYLLVIQKLYQQGARNMLLSYTDGQSGYLLPQLYTRDPTGTAALIFSIFADNYYEQLFSLLNDQLQTTLLDLNIQVFSVSDVASKVKSNPTLYGYRPALSTDIDPRSSFQPPSFPFPLYIEMYLERGVKLNTTFFHDNIHLTEHGYRTLANSFSSYVDAYLDNDFDFTSTTSQSLSSHLFVPSLFVMIMIISFIQM
jgi:hypothetical protein